MKLPKMPKPKHWFGTVLLVAGALLVVSLVLGLLVGTLFLLYLVWTEVHWSVALLFGLVLTYNFDNRHRIRKLEKHLEDEMIMKAAMSNLRKKGTL